MQVGNLSAELEEAKELADSRLKGSEQLSQQIVELRADLELATEAKAVVDVENSTPYLTLQSQFSIIQLGEGGGGEGGEEKRVVSVAENSQLRSSLEELKSLLYEARAHHFSQLDELRSVCI